MISYRRLSFIYEKEIEARSLRASILLSPSSFLMPFLVVLPHPPSLHDSASHPSQAYAPLKNSLNADDMLHMVVAMKGKPRNV